MPAPKQANVSTELVVSGEGTKAGLPVLSVADSYPVLTTSGEQWQSTVDELFGGQAITPQIFDKIKVPNGGGTLFTIPNDLNPDAAEDVPTVRGVVIAHHPFRTYWAAAFGSGDVTAPDCKSDDGVYGEGMYGVDAENQTLNPGGRCATCPMSSFANGRPKCSLKHKVYFMREGALTPTVIDLPPTSLANWKNLTVGLFKNGLGLADVLVEIGLKKDVNPQKMQFSRATFKAVAALPSEEATKMRQFEKLFRSWIAPQDDGEDEDEVQTISAAPAGTVVEAVASTAGESDF